MTSRVIFAGFMIMVAADGVRAGTWLGEMTWQEAATALPSKVVIIPFAAGAKEHGPHLPLSTDHLVMDHLLNAAVADLDVIVAPPILHGWFPAFRDYPGTEVADAAVFQSYVRSVAESLIRHGTRQIVFLNTGITRASGLPLSIVARDLRADRDVRTLVISWDDLESIESESHYQQQRGGHADEGETSIILYLRPDLVKPEQAVPEYRFEPSEQIGYAPGKFDRDSEPGHFGDPTLATREKGEALLRIMVGRFLLALEQFGVDG